MPSVFACSDLLSGISNQNVVLAGTGAGSLGASQTSPKKSQDRLRRK